MCRLITYSILRTVSHLHRSCPCLEIKFRTISACCEHSNFKLLDLADEINGPHRGQAQGHFCLSKKFTTLSYFRRIGCNSNCLQTLFSAGILNLYSSQIRSQIILLTKHWKHSHRSSKEHSETDEESEDESGDDDEESNAFFDEDEGFPKTYREIKCHVKSLRVDGVISAGLNLARSKVDDYFLGSKLRLNGERVLKKSKQVSVGDYIDLITSVEEDKIRVKRVRVLKVSERKTSKERMTVVLRTWRANVTIDNPTTDPFKERR